MIDFDDLRRANLERLPLFKDRQGNIAHDEPDGSDWRPADWMTAITGEVGELAGELKKARRGDYGSDAKEAMRYGIIEGVHPIHTPIEIREKIMREMADVVIYLDLLAHQFNIDLGEAVTLKFNEVSERVGVNVKL